LPLYTEEQFNYFPENDALNYKQLFLFSEPQEELKVMLIKKLKAPFKNDLPASHLAGF
jgi:hypothetical protein